MNQSWRATTMRDVMAEFYDGPHATPPPASEGPIYLGIKNMTEDGHIDLSEVRHIAESEYPAWTRRVEPRAGDLIFTYEASLHRYAIIPEGFRGTLGRRVALLRPRRDIVDTRFLLYLFISPQWRETVQRRINIGSTVDRLPLTDFPQFPLRIPSLQTQRKLAAILSAYDDLIDNNNRRIKLLEEMAQRIYREWFVDFRYPGREDVPLVDSELGPIPAGWAVRTIAEVCSSIDYGYTASAESECIGPRLIRITDIVPPQIDWTTVPYCKIDDDRIERFRLLEGDVVVARTGATVGFAKRINKRHPTSVFASYLVRFRAGHEADDIWLGTFLESDAYKAYVRANAGGAAQPNASARLLAAADIALPTREVQALYRGAVSPLVDQRELLQIANVDLRSTRDLLLPRLISGAIDVNDLDIAVPETAA